MNTLENIVKELRKNKHINVKRIDENIASYNFSRDVFRKKIWNDMTVKARGLFIDSRNMRVKARSYDKFFTLGERPETELEYIYNNWEFPIDVYVKENGYLGICSWNEDGTLFCASKSSTDSWYAQRFRELLEEALGNNIEKFSRRLQKENLSAIFEVIDPINDRHIIEYDFPHIVLLDLVYNEWEPGDLEFLNKSYEVLKTWGILFNLKIKEKAYRLNSIAELDVFVKDVTSVGYSYHKKNIEGFVLEDMDMNYVKIKTDYYNYWKAIRGMIIPLSKEQKCHTKWIDKNKHPEFEKMFNWMCVFLPRYYKITHQYINVILLRQIYESYLEK